MKTLTGRPVFKGNATGRALVTRQPMNFTAAFTKPANLIPWKHAEVQDRHHELFKKNIKNTILVFPACIGSTYTGLMLLELIHNGAAPRGLIVQRVDSLLASGIVLGDVWFHRSLPVVEYGEDDIFDQITTGDRVKVNGSTGEMTIWPLKTV